MTGLLAVKLVRDLRASWSRFVLMVIAISVSLTVFGGMLMAWASIGRETSDAYMRTEPASATLVFEEPVAVEAMERIATEARTLPGVIEATGRTQLGMAVEVDGRAIDRPLYLFAAAPDDPMRVVRFDLASPGAWPPTPGDVWVRSDSLPYLGAKVGDTITVTTPGDRQVPLRIAGTVYDPSLAPSMQELRAYGYISTASFASLGLPASFDQLKIQVADPGDSVPTRSRDAVMAVASAVGTRVQERYGVTVDEIQVPEPYAHPHQWQADVLLLSLVAGGAAALVLSTILVANMLNNLLTQQIPQIGILKAIGARSGQIGRLYVAMTLVVAGAATILALVPASAIGQYLLGWLLGMLGVEPLSLAAPWWTFLVVAVLGLGLPPLMALAPLLRASRTTVRAAIDHHGLGSKPGRATGVLARLSQLRGLDRGLLMALRNTIRRPARFWLSVGLLASAGSVFVSGMSLSAGTQAVDEERTAQRYWDVDVALVRPASEATVRAALEDVPSISRIETWTRSQVGVAGPGEFPFTRTYPDQGHGSISLNTVLDDPTLPPPTVVDGRWLQRGETGAVVLNEMTRDNTVPELGAGDDVELFIGGRRTAWRIVGIVEEREGSGGGVYTTSAGLAAALGRPPQVNQVRLITEDHDEPTRAAAAGAAEKALTGVGIGVAMAASVTAGAEASSAHLGPVILVLLGVALPLGVVGIIGLASIMSANILDRTREFGVMHAIGARPRAVRRIVTSEGVFLALTSVVAAVVPTIALTALMGAGLGDLFQNAPLPFRISPLAVGIWIALVVFGAILATDAAAARASRITVREALAYI